MANPNQLNDLLNQNFTDCGFARKELLDRIMADEHAAPMPDDPLHHAYTVLAAQKRPAAPQHVPVLPLVTEPAAKPSQSWFSFFTRDKVKPVAPEQTLDQQQQSRMKK